MNKNLRHHLASKIAKDAKHEIDKSEEQDGPFHSLLEGLTVLREQYFKLEQEIFGNAPKNTDTVRLEAIQVAAVATRIAMMVSPVPDIPNRHKIFP